MSKSVKRMIADYDETYGDIPDDSEGQLDYIINHYGIDPDNYKDEDLESQRRIRTCHWNLPLMPWAAKRPRSSGNGHFYVEGAAANRKLVQSLIEYEGIIYTLCEIDIGIYVPIPYSSMSKKEIYMAYKGFIRPMNEDWDNFAKTYCDSIQNILIINDNIITGGSCSKFYSVKPHVTLDIKYDLQFDSKFNERKITKSKSYQRNIERVKLNEYTAELQRDKE